MKSLLFLNCAMLLLLTSCAGLRIAPRSGDTASLSFGSFFGGSTTTLGGNQVTFEQTTAEGAPTLRKKRTVSEADVARFWTRIDGAHVTTWKAKYCFQKSDGRPQCGYGGWSIKINRGTKEVLSEGYGAYPADGNPARTKEHKSSTCFDEVTKAFEDLCDPRWRH